MAELLSVGLDVGTTTTQLILSRMEVRNNASAFAVPELPEKLEVKDVRRGREAR